MNNDARPGFRPALRFRCVSCGNLTRFDVVRSATTSSFFHYTVGGELVEEDVTVIAEHVDEVTCRWCGPRGEVVEIDNDLDPPDGDDQPPGS